jgi:ABC-type Fe3+ transport system permease subunit
MSLFLLFLVSLLVIMLAASVAWDVYATRVVGEDRMAQVTVIPFSPGL